MIHQHKTKLLSGVRSISPLHDQANEPLSIEPITITVDETCRITGYRPTTIWKLIKERKIRVLRLKDVRRTLPYLASVKELLGQSPAARDTSAGPPARRRKPDRHPATAQQSLIAPTPPPRRRGQPRKVELPAAEAP